MTRRWVAVVETEPYLRKAEQLLSEDERAAVVEMLARDPNCGDVMRGTGGVRKVRFALAGRGKSGGARVVYFLRNEDMPVFLLTVFAKNEKGNLSEAERNAMAKVAEGIARQYGGR